MVLSRQNLRSDSRRLQRQSRPSPLTVPPLNGVRSPGLYLCRLGPQVISNFCYLLLVPSREGVKLLQELLQLGICGEAVGLILVLLNLRNDLCHLAPLGKIDQL